MFFIGYNGANFKFHSLPYIKYHLFNTPFSYIKTSKFPNVCQPSRIFAAIWIYQRVPNWHSSNSKSDGPSLLKQLKTFSILRRHCMAI